MAAAAFRVWLKKGCQLEVREGGVWQFATVAAVERNTSLRLSLGKARNKTVTKPRDSADLAALGTHTNTEHLGKKEKSAVEQFSETFDPPLNAQAWEALNASNWEVEAATDLYLRNATGDAKSPSTSSSSSSGGGAAGAGAGASGGKVSKAGGGDKLVALFDKYAGESKKGVLEDEALAAYLRAINVDPEAGASLVLAYRLGCKERGTLGRQEFIDGWRALGVETVEGMKKTGQEAARLLDTYKSDEFGTFYDWLFDFCASDRKTIEVEEAVFVWGLAMGRWAPMERWCAWLPGSGAKAVSHDLWRMLRDCATTCKPDLSDVDTLDGPWPALLSEFVEAERKDASA